MLLCLSNILSNNFRNCKPSKCKNKLPLSLNLISQYDIQVKYSDGIYDPVWYLSYNSRMKKTVSKFRFALSYKLNVRILVKYQSFKLFPSTLIRSPHLGCINWLQCRWWRHFRGFIYQAIKLLHWNDYVNYYN